MHQSYLKKPTDSQINLIKNAKNYFYCWKNTSSAQLCKFSGIGSFKKLMSKEAKELMGQATKAGVKGKV